MYFKLHFVVPFCDPMTISIDILLQRRKPKRNHLNYINGFQIKSPGNRFCCAENDKCTNINSIAHIRILIESETVH